jgi:hypothetical protein
MFSRVQGGKLHIKNLVGDHNFAPREREHNSAAGSPGSILRSKAPRE